jgi:Ca-activated chloride channel family protein
MLTESWKELGPWLVLALLPLGALAFRRGWVVVIALLVANLSLTAPRPAMAFGWDDLWQRRDQQAARALEDADYDRARELAQDPLRSGTASYRLGDYDAAVDAFAAGDSPEHHYNRGNALAAAGRLEDAVAAYDEALARTPDMADALYNKAQIEQLLKQQQQQQQQQDQQQQSDGGQQGDQSDQSQQSGSDQANEQGPDEQGSDAPQNGEQASAEDESPESQDGQQQDASQDQGGDQSGQQEQQAGEGDDQQQGSDAGQQQAEGEGAQPETGSQASQQGTAQDNTGRDDGGASADADAGDDNGVAQDKSERDRAEQAAEDYRAEAAAQSGDTAEQPPPDGAAAAAADSDEEPTPEELESRQAADQWLRRIPDDPAGLLRRKFLYQYRARAEEGGEVEAGNPW